MVTKVPRRRLFLKEHRKAKGISADKMAEALGIERESVHRLERELMTRATPEKLLIYSRMCDVEPEELWRPPGTHSLDALVAPASEDVKQLAADIVRRLVTTGR